MRRGFKAEAARTATEVRREIGLSDVQPLDPWALAAHLAIPVWPLSSFAFSVPSCVEALRGDAHGEFHAMIAFVGRRQVIVHNDANALTRQRADLAHEIAHALLLHRPHRVNGVAPVYDTEQEEEANFLGGSLLVPDAACLEACMRGLTVEQAAAVMQVSPRMMQWRMNASGACRRVQRSRAARR